MYFECDSQDFDQIRDQRHLPYREFKRKVIEIFKKPDITQYQIKELCSIQQYEDEGPDAFMTRMRAIAREAFRKLRDEEQQRMAGHAFCEGLKDRGVAALVATQARNSAARAVLMAAEATAVNTKKRETKRRSKSSRKALCGLPSQNAEGIVIAWRTLNRLWPQRFLDLR